MQIAQKNFYKKLLGKIGEKKASEHLKKKGYKLVVRNYKTRFGEADIIAYDKEILVFVEVKTREDNAFGSPCEAVTKEKQRRYFLVAKEYMQKNNLINVQCRFDVVEVKKDEINHIINAFYM